MKFVFIAIQLFIFSIQFLLSQDNAISKNSILQGESRKGQLYFYWGWSREFFTKSDIRFEGANYDFMLKNVIAYDRQTEFDLKYYANPMNITIPQYNFRIGYFLTDKYDISFGIDHMKYVMQNDQIVSNKGYIDIAGSIYNGIYNDKNINLSTDFLTFEHTDGLNYANIELRRTEKVYTIHSSKTKKGDISFNLIGGVGAGILLPRTNTKLMINERYDEFHLAGYGLGALAGLNITFLKYFYLQTELKGGFINMPDIRTTINESDRASQHFFFLQHNFTFGAYLNIFKQ